MDDLAHRLANRVVGNAEGAAALELTTAGPTLRFAGAGRRRRRRARRCRIDASTASRRRRGRRSTVAGRRRRRRRRGRRARACGPRSPCAAGSTSPPYLGSRSTFTLGGFGGHDGPGRCAPATCSPIGDRRRPAAPAPLPPGLAPVLGHDVGARRARRAAHRARLPHRRRASTPCCAPSGRCTSTRPAPASASSARGPAGPARDGGEAGLHPSNIHDTGYAVGAVDLTGDMPVILGPDGPSLGGFVCPAVVAASRAVEARPAARPATASGSCRGRPTRRPRPTTRGADVARPGRRRRSSRWPGRRGTARSPRPARRRRRRARPARRRTATTPA